MYQWVFSSLGNVPSKRGSKPDLGKKNPHKTHLSARDYCSFVELAHSRQKKKAVKKKSISCHPGVENVFSPQSSYIKYRKHSKLYKDLWISIREWGTITKLYHHLTKWLKTLKVSKEFSSSNKQPFFLSIQP